MSCEQALTRVAGEPSAQFGSGNKRSSGRRLKVLFVPGVGWDCMVTRRTLKILRATALADWRQIAAA